MPRHAGATDVNSAPRPLPLAFLAAALLAACDGTVAIGDHGATSGSGSSSGGGASTTTSSTASTSSTTTTSSSSSSSTSSSSTGATSSTSGGPDAGPTTCGGKAGTPCAPDAFCDFATNAACGTFDAAGVCQPRPQGCTADCPGVCGCDGSFYCNACSAHALGVDDDSNAVCAMPGDPGVYSAAQLPTNLQRLAIFKAYAATDLCVRIILVAGGGAPPSQIQCPSGWGVERTELVTGAKYCSAQNPWPPAGTTTAATTATGVIDFPPMGPPPCALDVHVKMSFPAGAPSSNDVMVANGVNVQGGCP